MPLCLLVLAIQTSFITLLAISGDSLWIDEFGSFLYASQQSLSDFWALSARDSDSHAQMPLYHLYLWSWTTIFGYSEYALRLANIPWVALGHLALMGVLRKKPGLFWVWFLLSMLHPFVLVYANEARPYAMQYGASCMLVSGLLRYTAICFNKSQCNSALNSISAPTYWWVAGTVFVCGSSLLGVIWAGAGMLFLGYLLLSYRQLREQDWKGQWKPLLLLLVSLTALAVYYLFTLLNGVRGRIAATNLLTIGFSAYEYLGFSGLGPGRTVLRVDGPKALIQYLPSLLAMSALWVLVSWQCVRSIHNWNRKQTFFIACACALLAFGFLNIAGSMVGFRVLGRHSTPIVTCVILTVAFGLSEYMRRSRRWPLLITSMLVLGFAFSSISLRVAERHSKDNYRAASVYAHTYLDQGRNVLWSANRHALIYYELADLEVNSLHGVKPYNEALLISLNAEAIADLPFDTPPDIMILSKQDAYDVYGVLRTLAASDYRKIDEIQAFSIWERNSSALK
jgi:hypothetical protein